MSKSLEITPIAKAIVHHMQVGNTQSAHNVLKTCAAQGKPYFDDGVVLKKVFSSPEFAELVDRAVREELNR